MKKILTLSFAILFILAFVAGCNSAGDNGDVGDGASPVTGPAVASGLAATSESVTTSESGTTISATAPGAKNDIEVLIKSNLDTLSKRSPEGTYYEDEADPFDNKLFKEIVALGKAALPYLKSATRVTEGRVICHAKANRR